MLENIQFGSRRIEFELVYEPRKSLGIVVQPDEHILVKAPLDSELEKIKTKVKKRAFWILKQQEFFSSFKPLTPSRKYINGETHLYLGRRYRLKINEGKPETVKLKNGFLLVHSGNKSDNELTKKMIEAWYKFHAEIHFNRIIKVWVNKFKNHSIPLPKLVIRKMNKRWGSCTPSGKIILNLDLIKAPKQCIEYVIVHELSHLIIPQHNQAFFKLQSEVMPDWKLRKAQLEKFLA